MNGTDFVYKTNFIFFCLKLHSTSKKNYTCFDVFKCRFLNFDKKFEFCPTRVNNEINKPLTPLIVPKTVNDFLTVNNFFCASALLILNRPSTDAPLTIF